MKTPSYSSAGIKDVSEFYATKFLSSEILDPRYFRPLDRFDMHFARTLWVYDNVREGSSLLDIGCGVGLLALLKRKNLKLSGVDLSDDCVEAAIRNGYDDARTGELTQLPFADSSFDYVASLDVLGHVAFEEKDQVLSEIKRVLKRDGVTLHGIECTDSFTHRSYDEMTNDELARFAAIDGHIGLETAEEHAERFRKFFTHVAVEPRYALCLSSEEFLKQADEYGLPYETDFLNYLRGLTHRERRAFDMAMGYVFNKISDLDLKLPASGLYTFLKASNVELGAFYNEHRDRRNLLGTTSERSNDQTAHSSEFCLDLTTDLDGPIRSEFDNGWYAPDDMPPTARWMGERSQVRFVARSLETVSFEMMTHMPGLGLKEPLEIHVLLNNIPIASCSLFRPGWTSARFYVPSSLNHAADDVFELTIEASKIFQPSLTEPGSIDDRELSIAVHSIMIGTAPSESR